MFTATALPTGARSSDVHLQTMDEQNGGGGGGEDCAATERHSALKRRETRWPGLNLVDILLREISQSQNCKNRVSPFLCGAWSSQIHGHGEQTESLLGLGQREEDCGMDVEFEVYKTVTFTLHVIFFLPPLKKKRNQLQIGKRSLIVEAE